MIQAVRVLDTSSLIQIKTLVRIDRQWDLFQHLQAMVDQAELAMPRQVIKEVGEVAHPDAPGVWARGMRDRLQHTLDVDPIYLKQVMQAAPKIIEANQQHDVADPYVVALALELTAAGLVAVVVTNDLVDHLPQKIALSTACDRLKVPHISCEEFLKQIGF